MKLKQVDEMPQSGEFLFVWVDNRGHLKGSPMKWHGNELWDGYGMVSPKPEHFPEDGLFIVKEE